MLERGLGEVDCGDPPPRLGEPDRLGTVPAARVEGLAGGEASDLGEQVRIRRATGHHVRMLAQGLRPAPVPGLAVERCAGHATSSVVNDRTSCQKPKR